MRTILLGAVVSLSTFHVGCSQCTSAAPAATSVNAGSPRPTDEWSPQPIDRPHLPNAYRLHDAVISGGQPDGAAGYRELRELGVQTVISVDAEQPPVTLAREHGLRYIHLPHGYDGVPEERRRELAKAVRDLPGPIYIHCHHGRHRSPAAAAMACIGAGLLQPAQGMVILRIARTSPHYSGLIESVARARRYDTVLLDALQPNFPETAPVSPMAEAMVAMERIHDQLGAMQQRGWQPPSNRPDWVAVDAALLLREHFTELLRTEEVRERPAAFMERLRESERASAELEASLRKWSDRRQPEPRSVADAYARISSNCQECHRQFRDTK